jgi:hypothetical protein
LCASKDSDRHLQDFELREQCPIYVNVAPFRARAKAKSANFGRPPSLKRQEAIQRLAKGEAQADIARSYAVSQSTISRLAPAPFVDGVGASAAAG